MGPPKKSSPKKVIDNEVVIEVTSKALLANLSPGKTTTPGGTDVLEKSATMNPKKRSPKKVVACIHSIV